MAQQMTKQPIEQKLAAALSNDSIGSEQLAELISESESSLLGAEATIDQVGERIVNDFNIDIDAANAMVAAAGVRRDRLHVALPKLRERLATATANEIRDRWLARAQRLQAKIDPLATEFRDTYSPAVETLLCLTLAKNSMG